jgi:serine/threonine protein kinase
VSYIRCTNSLYYHSVHSVGVVMYQMLSSRLPFEGGQTKSVLYAILDGRYTFPSPHFDAISDSAKDLITELICVDVTKRLSAAEALQHPWIVNEGPNIPIQNRSWGVAPAPVPAPRVTRAHSASPSENEDMMDE